MQEYDFKKPLLVNAEILLGALDAAASLKLDITGALTASGITEPMLREPKGFLNYHQVVQFLERAARDGNCPLFGFYVARHQPPLRFGLMAQLPGLCHTVRDSIEKTLRFSQIYSQESRWELECDEGYAFMKRYHRVSYPGPQTQLYLLATTLMIKASTLIQGEGVTLSAVYFSSAQPNDAAVLSRFFNAPVFFEQAFDGYAFPQSTLDTTLSSANPELLVIVEHHLQGLLDQSLAGTSLADQVEQLIRRHLGVNTGNIESIAQLLGMHPRALQRRLKKNGRTFRDLLNEVRLDIARQYLRSSGIGLVNLSDILGYRNVSAFSRAFKNATGSAPDVWRRAHENKAAEQMP